jgi:hypothetical protein
MRAPTFCVAIAALALFLAPGAHARPALDLQLRNDRTEPIELTHPVGVPADLVLPNLYVVAAGQPLELEAIRSPETRWRIRVRRRVPTSRGHAWRGTRLRASSFPAGLDDFFLIRVRDGRGRVRARLRSPFCPNTGQAAVDPLGPGVRRTSRFPFSCGHPFARRVPWGIERSWAASASQTAGSLDLPDGGYVAEVVMDPGHLLPDARRSNNHVRVALRVVSDSGGDEPPATAARRRPRVLAPDLFALPASGVSAGQENGRDLVLFNSMIGNAGPGPLVLEGRRNPPGPKPAVQKLRRAGGGWMTHPAGVFVYDASDGHFHWHYNHLARYRLLDAAGRAVRTSGKIGFCFVPTDVVDLPLGGHVATNEELELSNCGTSFSRSVKMLLPAGYGDEYSQSVAGQALDVTGLPDGRYAIEVAIDPPRRLRQVTHANDRSLRTIILGGTPGTRTVRALAWHGVTEPDQGF